MVKTLITLPIGQVTPDPLQPRKEFRPEELQELADSIKTNGLLQPIIVRRGEGAGYIIIAGERRWRACKSLGMKVIDAVVIDGGDFRALQLVENLNRANLNPIEVAEAYRQYLSEGHTVQELAEVTGIRKAQLEWHVQILNAGETVQGLVRQGHLGITVGVEMAKLSLNSQARAIRALVGEKLSVNEQLIVVARILAEETQGQMFTETKLSKEETAARKKAKSAIEKACSALQELAEIEAKSPGLLGKALASEIDITQEKVVLLEAGIKHFKTSLAQRKVNMLGVL